MGLLDWLKGKKAEAAEDRIWLSKTAKLDGILRAITAALADRNGPDAVFLLAHFQDCLDELREMVASNRFDDDRLLVALAEALPESPATASEGFRNVLVIVGERHPLRSHDERIVGFARSLSSQNRVLFNISLEDALSQQYAGEWLEGVLRRLGMKEDEMIQSHMVSRRLGQSQQKIASGVIGDKPAKSAQEWLELNWRAI